jgi:uncharacterized protein YjbI with pentapeptide repeats
MANDEHVALLKKSVAAWNRWRDENPGLYPDLSKANLSGANLRGETDAAGVNLMRADLRGADLREADLAGANLGGADLSTANLRWAYLWGADLSKANLSGANLVKATLLGARLYDAKLSGADLSNASIIGANFGGTDLSGARLEHTSLADTDFMGADLTGCRIYGISAWNLKLEGAKQQNLIITRKDEPTVTVDNIEVAQFIYLMLNNQKVRDVIDTITSKAVLILGRFTDERKAVLDALREELRKRDYLPILFDFAPSNARDITETISLLARMARFVVADITDAKSIPQELAVIVPDLPSVPVQPLLLEGSTEYSMFEHFKRYPWVLETYRYPSSQRLIADLGERVIEPAEKWRSKSGERPTQR